MRSPKGFTSADHRGSVAGAGDIYLRITGRDIERTGDPGRSDCTSGGVGDGPERASAAEKDGGEPVKDADENRLRKRRGGDLNSRGAKHQ